MKYAIRITGIKQNGYYAAGSPYVPVPRDRADLIDRKQVDQVCATLRKLGYKVSREKIT